MSDTTKNYVNGEWIESGSGDTIEVENPANPSEVAGRYQSSSTADATEAVEAAAAAADDWASTPGPERGRDTP